jgi:hypothetical protein
LKDAVYRHCQATRDKAEPQVLLGLAHLTRENGSADDPVPALMHFTGLSQSAVEFALQGLRFAGYIAWAGVHYTILHATDPEDPSRVKLQPKKKIPAHQVSPL